MDRSGCGISSLRRKPHQEARVFRHVRFTWEDGSEIRTGVENDAIVISGNREGLLSLANHLKVLAEEVPGSHIHLDEDNSLERGSVELIIEKVSNE